jgi:hypothetical protein
MASKGSFIMHTQHSLFSTLINWDKVPDVILLAGVPGCIPLTWILSSQDVLVMTLFPSRSVPWDYGVWPLLLRLLAVFSREISVFRTGRLFFPTWSYLEDLG